MTKYILSLDGGGIRGAATAMFLCKLEQDSGASLFDKFDMFVGTSTGGIIAMAIGLLKMDGNKIGQLYNYDNGNKIMDKSIWDRQLGIIQAEPKYDGIGKRNLLNHYFKDRSLHHAKKPLMVMAYDIQKREAAALKSFDGSHIDAVKAADATSAAPLYFPSVSIDGRWLIDGGVIANNPAMCAYAESRRLWPGDDIRVLSIGTGKITRPIPGRASQEYGALEWIRHDLLGVMMDETVVNYQMKTLLGKNYLRINSELVGANDDMDDCSGGNIENLKRLGDKWYQDYKDDIYNFFLG